MNSMLSSKRQSNTVKKLSVGALSCLLAFSLSPIGSVPMAYGDDGAVSPSESESESGSLVSVTLSAEDGIALKAGTYLVGTHDGASISISKLDGSVIRDSISLESGDSQSIELDQDSILTCITGEASMQVPSDSILSNTTGQHSSGTSGESQSNENKNNEGNENSSSNEGNAASNDSGNYDSPSQDKPQKEFSDMHVAEGTVEVSPTDFKFSNENVSQDGSFDGIVHIKGIQKGVVRSASSNDDNAASLNNDALKSFKISLSAPNSMAKIDENTIKLTRSDGQCLYDASDDTIARQGTVSIDTIDGTQVIVFSFNPDYLTEGMQYSGESYSLTADARMSLPKDLSEVASQNDGNGNLLFDNDSTLTTVIDNSLNSFPHEETVSTNPSGNSKIKIVMPKLKAVRSLSETKANAYDQITYKLTISNTEAGTIAKGIIITDTPGDDLYDLGGAPQDVKVTKNGTQFDLNDKNYSIYNGKITINLGTVDMSSTDPLVVEYTVSVGDDLMRTDKSRLGGLLALDNADSVGSREVSVKAANVLDTVQVSDAFDLLRPAASVTSDIDKNVITTGETASVTDTFTIEGADDNENGAKLINPVISLTSPSQGSVSNIKVNGTDYVPGTSLSDIDTGSSLILTYDIIAPSDYSDDVNGSVDTLATLSADNIADSISANARTTIVIPNLSLVVNLSTMTPSSSSLDGTSEPLHVVFTIEQNANEATAKEFDVRIQDSPRIPTDEVLESGFDELKVKLDGNEIPISDDELKKNADGSISIHVDELDADSILTIEYDDILKSGYEINGKSQDIDASVVPSMESNIPSSAEAKASTSFTVGTPKMNIEQKVTNPVDADTGDAEAVNVGDIVSLSTVFNQQNEDDPLAEGRDFALDVSIDDVINDNVSYSAADLGVNFIDADGVLPTKSITNVVYGSDSIASDASEVQEEIDKDSDASVQTEPSGDDEASDSVEDKPSSDANDANDENHDNAQDGKAVSLISDGNDVTDSFDIRFLDKDGNDALSSKKPAVSIEVIGKDNTDMPKSPVALNFKAVIGSSEATNFDQLAGTEISFRSTSSVSNLKDPVDDSSVVLVADAAISVEKIASTASVQHGDVETYSITLLNDKDDLYSSDSQAKNVVISDSLDKNTSDFGYRIDASSVTAKIAKSDGTTESIDVKDATESDDTSAKTSSLNLVLPENLSKGDEITITYNAVTDDINADSYSNSLGNVVIVTADNSKPAVATSIVFYDGVDITGVGQDSSGSLTDAISQTGDSLPYVIIVLALIAIAAGVTVVIIRKKNK